MIDDDDDDGGGNVEEEEEEEDELDEGADAVAVDGFCRENDGRSFDNT